MQRDQEWLALPFLLIRTAEGLDGWSVCAVTTLGKRRAAHFQVQIAFSVLFICHERLNEFGLYFLLQLLFWRERVDTNNALQETLRNMFSFYPCSPPNET